MENIIVPEQREPPIGAATELPENNNQQAQANFLALASTESHDVIKAAHGAAVINLANNDEEVKEKIKEIANKNIGTALETEATKVELEHAKTKFKVNKSACGIYGVEEDSTPHWQQRLMKIGAGFWFIIYFLTIGSFIVAPISTFTIKLANILKKTWLAIIVSIILYVIIAVGIPFAVKYFKI